MTKATLAELIELGLDPNPMHDVHGIEPLDVRDRPRFKPWTYDEYLRLPPTPWLVGDDDHPGLIANGLWVTFGLYKSGKTFWEMEKAFCVAFGIPFHGSPVTQGRIAYVCAEGAVTRLMERLIALCEHHKLDPAKSINSGQFNLITSAVDLISPDGAAGVDTLLDQLEVTQGHGEPFVAVWLDTWAQMLAASGGHDTDAETVMPAVRGCVRIREALNCSVVIVAHVGLSEKAQDRPKGLSDLPGAVDGGTKIEKDGKGEGAIHTATAMIQRYAPDGFQQMAKLVTVGPSHVMQHIERRDAARAKLGYEPNRCLEVLRGLGEGEGVGVAVEVWRDACQKALIWRTNDKGGLRANWRDKWKRELAKLIDGNWVSIEAGAVTANDLD